MAKENVKKFIEKVSKNKELQEKIAVAQKGYKPEGKSEEEIFEDIVLPIAKEVGCEFTMSEYRAAQREAMAEKGIREEELENVSGGGIIYVECILIGFSIRPTAGACVSGGVGTGDTNSGIGACACLWVGIGLGASGNV